jgi:hypothetical protein
LNVDSKETVLRKLREKKRFDLTKFLKKRENFILEKQGIFRFPSKFFINSMWLLFILLIIGMGANASNSEILLLNFENEIKNHTNFTMSEINTSFKLSGSIGVISGWIFCIFMLIVLLLYSQITNLLQEKSKYLKILFQIFNFENPIYTITFSLVFIAISQITLLISILNSSFVFIVLSKVLGGVFYSICQSKSL